MKKTNLLDEINVMKGAILKLSPTTRKSKVITINLNPILMPFNIGKLGVGNIIVPYLQISHKIPSKPEQTSIIEDFCITI